MNFERSANYLLSLGNEVSAMKLRLASMQKLLAELGDPQVKFFKLQVAGTNGKGSVCAFLDAVLRAAKLRVGLYTSPHLSSMAERIKIDGEKIDEREFAALATRVRAASERLVERGELGAVPTFFEQMTAIAMLAFKKAKVDIAILETGLGGRLDATTAAEAEIAAITRIDRDHEKYLGNSLRSIAAEKAAIIRKNTQFAVLGEQPASIGRNWRNGAGKSACRFAKRAGSRFNHYTTRSNSKVNEPSIELRNSGFRAFIRSRMQRPRSLLPSISQRSSR
ncbi:MAG: bifunctional folylpolyglutamate synthase/dihydrofolate synthase [Acidobacteria bacterium OLB17]|nr:MAG: bifunctional folylpolyglutamate synthase/dihydrofolate synthase [Acidobacteria bacterium OLB17]